MWISKIDGSIQSCFQFSELRKFGTVIKCDALRVQILQRMKHCVIHSFAAKIINFDCDQLAGFAVNQCDESAFSG